MFSPNTHIHGYQFWNNLKFDQHFMWSMNDREKINKQVAQMDKGQIIP
jgi:hypothetical protein